ncbi:ESF1 -like protein [Halotydeus destructor]|nr:ESF1 -like protein [Halotydeus destructor]
MDPRFTQVLNDPRFRTLKKKERKVKVDKRFEKMFTDKKFKFKSTIDKRGKAVEHESTENMKAYYDMSDEEKEKTDEVEDETELEVKANAKPDNVKTSTKVPDARGEDSGDDLLSSSSDEELSEDEKEDFDHKWGELDADVKRGDCQGKRLAVCNIEWDRIKAVDLFLLFNSFKPQGSSIVSVKVFPSEFGKKRLAEEEVHGPAELVGKTVEQSDDENRDEDGEGNSYATEKLRQYQINRLKYYYAIVECDNSQTAAFLYDELDGFEYESSASALDVRVVSDDVDFDDAPANECKTMPDPNNYRPPIFITTALQQSKVALTWDETDPRRKEKFESMFEKSKKETMNDDIEAYLASSSSEESDAEVQENITKVKSSDKINKYKDLLKSLEENDDDVGDVEVDWNNRDGTDDEDNIVKQSHSQDAKGSDEDSEASSELPDEKEVKSKASKKEDRIDKVDDSDDDEPATGLELLVADDNETEKKSHFNFENFVKDSKKKKKRSKEEPEDDFSFDAEDPRFSAIYTSHLYNVDQSDPHFKRTEAMEKLLDKKRKNPISKDKSTTNDDKNESAEKSQDYQLTSLINSVKSKTKSFHSKRRKL